MCDKFNDKTPDISQKGSSPPLWVPKKGGQGFLVAFSFAPAPPIPWLTAAFSLLRSSAMRQYIANLFQSEAAMTNDLELRHQILVALRQGYPEGVDEPSLPGFNSENFRGTLAYLAEHGLIVNAVHRIDHGRGTYIPPRITARGLDFLEDDGGLSAILNTVTVRFEADTLRALLSASLDQAQAGQEEKAKARGILANLSGEAMKALVHQLVGAAVAKVPEALPWILTAGKSLLT